MKYIRTKDGIYDLKLKPKYENDKETIEWFINHYYGGMNNLIKVGNSIEELCDEFVFENGISHYLTSNKKMFEMWIRDSKDKNTNFFGAVWTDKGLIYVAKINDKGELELL